MEREVRKARWKLWIGFGRKGEEETAALIIVHSMGGLIGVPHPQVHSVGELGILIWGHDFQSLSLAEKRHLHHPPVPDKDTTVASLAFALQQVLSWNSLKQSNLAALSSVFYCLCFVIVYIQLRLISVLRKSEFLPSTKEKSLTGNKSTIWFHYGLRANSSWMMNCVLYFVVVVKYISNDT